MSSKLEFHGGIGSVTGANFVLETDNKRIMIDCGLIQGDKFAESANREPFPYNPAEIDVLLVTHAHADHIGRIPKLVRDGFQGVIYSTLPTKELAAVMYEDAYRIMIFEEEKFGLERIYEKSDIEAALAIWKTVEYEKTLPLAPGLSARFTDAGHILGSAMVHVERGDKQVVFTGDVGNVPQPLLNSPVIPRGYDYMIMESVYGDRSHEEVEERTSLLRMFIEETRKQQGTLIIPAFSLERTQAMLLEINNLVEKERMEPLPVFLDSPLAIRVTEIYKKYTTYMKTSVREQIKAGDDIFAFSGLKFTRTVEDSRDIHKVHGAKIIIAGSGMSHGGRIQEHEKRYLEEKDTTLLLVGYQAVGSLGRRLVDGAKRVRIHDTEVKVKAKVARIRGYSGHADREQLIDLVARGGDNAKQIFVTMGEEKSSLHLVQRLRDYLGVNAIAPSPGQVVEIDF